LAYKFGTGEGSRYIIRRYYMKKLLVLFGFIIFAASLSGCVTVKKVVRERVDQDVSGNKGYLMGSSEDASGKARPVDREYLDIRIEVPTWQEVTAPAVPYEDETTATATKPKEYSAASKGNKGYMTGREKIKDKKTSKAVTVYEYDDYEVDIYDDEGEILAYEEIEAKPAYTEYTVKQGETLSHIAKAFYNKASKWTVIYEANSDKIKDPSKVRAGTKLRIPELSEVESKYVK
jgi:LysM repeat protein